MLVLVTLISSLRGCGCRVHAGLVFVYNEELQPEEEAKPEHEGYHDGDILPVERAVVRVSAIGDHEADGYRSEWYIGPQVLPSRSPKVPDEQHDAHSRDEQPCQYEDYL